jgi:peptide/nickel transport system permease protein
MLLYILKRVFYVVPVALGVSLLCFLLVHIAPGDPLVSVLPADASQALVEEMRKAYGFDRPLPAQFALWLGRALAGEVMKAVANTFLLAVAATLVGFVLGGVLGFVAGYFRDSWIDRLATTLSIVGVSVPHYWLGMVLVILFAVTLNWLPASGAGPGGSSQWAWDWEHAKYLILPAVTMSVIPMGIVTRTLRALVGDILGQEFVDALRAKGMRDGAIFLHVVKNAAPTALAVMGLQLGYLLGGSILIETVFSWPGTGFLLNAAIFQRDLPLLQGTILVLGIFFVALNLLVDVAQAALDPRIRRS